VYAVEWIEHEGDLYVLGNESNTNIYKKIKIKQKPGLFVWVRREIDLEIIRDFHVIDWSRKTKNYDVIDHITGYTANDRLLGARKCTGEWKMYFIPTINYSGSVKLYQFLNNQEGSTINTILDSFIKTTGE
jgi:hypothetical protein